MNPLVPLCGARKLLKKHQISDNSTWIKLLEDHPNLYISKLFHLIIKSYTEIKSLCFYLISFFISLKIVLCKSY